MPPRKKSKRVKWTEDFEESFQFDDFIVPTAESDEGRLWVDCFEPQRWDELVVHKKKLEELRNALENYANGGQEKLKILLLSGQSGTGKNLALKLACSDLNIQLIQWDNPFFQETAFDSGMDDERKESSIESFCEFLKKFQRFKEALKLYRSVGRKREAILVRDVPYCGNKHVFQKFYSSLRDYLLGGELLLIFVFTVCRSHTTEDNTLFSDYLYFPADIRSNVKFKEIKFNPIAKSFMSKHFQAVLKRQLKVVPSKDVMEQIFENSHGDLRQAINSLQFLYLLPSIGSLDDKNKDEQDFLFQILGKTLYYKKRSQDKSEGLSETVFSYWSDLKTEMVPSKTLSVYLSSEIPKIWQHFYRIERGLQFISDYDCYQVRTRQSWQVSQISMDSLASGLLLGSVYYSHEGSPDDLAETLAADKKFYAIRRPELFQALDNQKANDLSMSLWYDEILRINIEKGINVSGFNKKNWKLFDLPYLKSILCAPKNQALKQILPSNIVSGICGFSNFSKLGYAKTTSAGSYAQQSLAEEEFLDISIVDENVAPNSNELVLTKEKLTKGAQQLTNWWEQDDDIVTD
jgi:DNA polymerase III delta prime subunit